MKEPEWDYGLLDWKDLDGKEGKITVGIDYSTGADCSAVVLHDKNGASYLLPYSETKKMRRKVAKFIRKEAKRLGLDYKKLKKSYKHVKKEDVK